ncbi:hypothetical protein ASC64_03755 [Nocardioides sp. Root122]|uniref:hypothetical protein n=1 Tax=Nocardioides TaxID=1839 RepID=UPI00070291E8|nr:MULTISPECIES: hypothetical protein [Nocardioides]KQV77939.1 hypothetical protein ASC64_03755 [Nocardioides sp. Root122]MCK9826035.1 hypothetical protein [Nocardioides cavernae]
MTNSSRRSGARTRTRSVATLVTGLALATALTACGDGDDGDDTATDPAASSSSSSDEPTGTPSQSAETPTESSDPDGGAGESIATTGSAGVTEAVVLHGTEAGGSVSEMAFALDTDQARADFASQFDGGFGDVVSQTALQQAQQDPSSTPYAATVAVGCEGPSAVAIDAGEAGFQVVPTIPKTTKQCLAPMTYVVVFAAPNA